MSDCPISIRFTITLVVEDGKIRGKGRCMYCCSTRRFRFSGKYIVSRFSCCRFFFVLSCFFVIGAHAHTLSDGKRNNKLL